ncbi:hypothetical protein N7532_001538 [Penicillium argentinense]|uniref:SnoaL-like domain-containing protein n=1 Tax=Penicillium argentinense TaxID=1131581 RepID=A0A9W9G2X7_9EURO|nr:uncharacterized protein N7532_001538 [Penicillium argentinense]KAJ5111003.1 hypothetical protein N7532_001538 [Penicillium argentinense]
MTPKTSLTEAVQHFLNALTASPPSTPNLLKTFTTNPRPLIHEHGLQQLAPFLGRTFTGSEGVTRYFEILAQYLSIEKMGFESEDAWVVDEESMTVSLRGSARFVWKETGQAWDETFFYRLGLARDEGEGKVAVCEYRIWADTGAAYLARIGRLEDVLAGDSLGKEQGQKDVLGGGLNVYGSCG